jgi:hypothetical protein
MLSLPAEEPGESEVATTAILRGNTLTNSIRAFFYSFNASGEPPPTAGAQRTLEGVGCRPM